MSARTPLSVFHCNCFTVVYCMLLQCSQHSMLLINIYLSSSRSKQGLSVHVNCILCEYNYASISCFASKWL